MTEGGVGKHIIYLAICTNPPLFSVLLSLNVGVSALGVGFSNLCCPYDMSILLLSHFY